MIPSSYELLMKIAKQKERIAYLTKKLEVYEPKETLDEFNERHRKIYEDENEDD